MVDVDIACQKLSSLPFTGFCGVDAVGLSGGLVLLWSSDVQLVLVSVSSRFVLCKITNVNNEISYMLFVYGAPHYSDRWPVWEKISSIIAEFPNIILIGDFNQVEFLDDKLGGSTHIQGRHEFINWRLDNGLIDIPFSGSPFTWTNGRHDNSITFERLDKAYASDTWFQVFLDASLLHQPLLLSDHAAIILRTDCVLSSSRPYRIENWCLQAKQVVDFIVATWAQQFLGSPMFSVSSKLNVIRRFMLSWCVQNKLMWGINWRQLSSEVFNAAVSLSPGPSASLFITTRDECVARAQATFMYWRQRSKVKWDAFGDCHSKLLFSSVQARKRKNRILSLQDTAGRWISSAHGLRSLIFDFYSDLFQVYGLADPLVYDWSQVQLPELSSSDKDFLMTPFTPEDIRRQCLILEIPSLQGLMGFPHPSLRPTGALLALKLMSDDCLIAHELISFINAAKARKKFFAVLKLDMNKAYDRVRWDFLFQALQAFGFPPYWVLVNGEPSRSFQPRCGLRQGDPLSPYLFVLCMEVLSAFLRQAESQRLIEGISIARGRRLFPIFSLQMTPFCSSGSISGQMRNHQKSFVKFSPNTPPDYRDYLASSLRLTQKTSLGPYLGVPVDLVRSKCSAFYDLVDKIARRIANFTSLRLSSATKLISFVLGFGGGQNPESKGIALVSASSFHLPRGMGGLGIRKVRAFNQALLEKSAWRMVHHPQLLISRLFKARYPALSLQNCNPRVSRPSWGFWSIVQGFQVLDLGIA
ncbi:uncharacterized protein [Spinacia oleracea]|uniref:Reverse transcriptase domain-containing protein n=1 Tax=Spinacia oleracea TaxID=3562 RepID=A0A9R0ITH0_SPIOL|nr:uncharacterized protein LOC110794055 [Spinacia oleracea]